jgi:protein gp37
MGANTKIEWARHTLNPWYGCQNVSPACDHCYAEAWAKRSGLVEWGPHAPRRRSSPAAWKEPLKWDKAARAAGEKHSVFGPSLGDAFDNHVDPAWRRDYFDLMRATPNLIYLLLTKRPQNIVEMSIEAGGLPANAALGTTVEDQKRADQNVPALLKAKVELSPLFVFLSCEPLLGTIDLRWITEPDEDADGVIDALGGFNWIEGPGPFAPYHPVRPGHLGRVMSRQIIRESTGIDWLICGGESGPNARPMHPAWERSLREQCAAAGVPYFRKQWGEWLFDPLTIDARGSLFHKFEDGTIVQRIGKKHTGSLLDGVEHRALPPQLLCG